MRSAALAAATLLAGAAHAGGPNSPWNDHGRLMLNFVGADYAPVSSGIVEPTSGSNPAVSQAFGSPNTQGAFGETKCGANEYDWYAFQKYTVSSSTITTVRQDSVAIAMRYCTFEVRFALDKGASFPTTPVAVTIKHYIKHTASVKLSGFGAQAGNSNSYATIGTENYCYFDNKRSIDGQFEDVATAKLNGDTSNGWPPLRANGSFSKKTGYVKQVYVPPYGGSPTENHDLLIDPSKFTKVGAVDEKGRQLYTAPITEYILVRVLNIADLNSAKGKIDVDNHIEGKVNISFK